MISGAFQVGETVKGSMRPVGDTSTSEGDSEITFRLSQANHKSGTFNSASEVFTKNHYNKDQTLPSAYSSTSTILNIDTFSLCEQPQSEFIGSVSPEMILVGETSGAQKHYFTSKISIGSQCHLNWKSVHTRSQH